MTTKAKEIYKLVRECEKQAICNDWRDTAIDEMIDEIFKNDDDYAFELATDLLKMFWGEVPCVKR
jgi:hypothetical protein